jgi:hypothetical protein
MAMFWLSLAKVFCKIGNTFWHKHVACLRKRQSADGRRWIQ